LRILGRGGDFGLIFGLVMLFASFSCVSSV
jgi:hypothetical protein